MTSMELPQKLNLLEEKYNKYIERIKKANKKYIDSHRDIINEKYRDYYRSRLASNEEYKAKKRAYNKQLYEKKKLLKAKQGPSGHVQSQNFPEPLGKTE